MCLGCSSHVGTGPNLIAPANATLPLTNGIDAFKAHRMRRLRALPIRWWWRRMRQRAQLRMASMRTQVGRAHTTGPLQCSAVVLLRHMIRYPRRLF